MNKLTVEELEQKYAQIPQEIKLTKRWICYNIVEKDGRETKVPVNAITGDFARSNDPLTWTTFRIAILGCVKYQMAGIGFMLGEDATTHTNYFGIDLDNHIDQVTGKKPMTEEEFYDFTTEFVNALNSYSEYSHSGEGIHIICKGTLPIGARRKNGVAVEMYEKGRFFTMTGKVINNVPINDRTKEIEPLWDKYLNTHEEEHTEENFNGIVFGKTNHTVVEIQPSNLDDNELIEKIRSSRYGPEFIALYHGDMSAYSNDHSAADMALCKILAFWTGCDKVQMDRMFRNSALMRDKWEQKRGQDTYGHITIEKAIASQKDVYTPAKEQIIIETKINEPVKPNVTVKQQPITQQNDDIVLFDEKNDPIVKVKKIFKTYPLTDTGNAERFYDYFGESFRYNSDNKFFMYWDGKTWSRDGKGMIRKYANMIIDILKSDITNTEAQMDEALKKGDEGKKEFAELNLIYKAQNDNLKKVSNKAGKDAMISEFQSLHEIAVINKEFDTQENLLNTDSGVVDLKTGEIRTFDKKLMLSKNTNCKVSFEEPKTWLKFLNDIFERPHKEETQELIDIVQMALGESLTGRTNKEHLYILYGHGSNGKSTFIKVVNDVFGDYGTTVNSSLLIQNPNASAQSQEFSMSALLGARFVSTSETAEGKKLDEVTIKQMLSGEKINAQFKYGNPFSFSPTFSPWMSTNNKPIIRATDFGTWRRIFFIPFLNTFTDDKKDVDMPKKLERELPEILGWMIKGAVKLQNEYKNILPKPKCIEEALSDYKEEMDVIVSYLKDHCIDFPGFEIEASKLYQDYKQWTKDNTEYCYSESKFKNEMVKKGYQLKKDLNKGWIYIGLKLSTDKKGIVFGE